MKILKIQKKNSIMSTQIYLFYIVFKSSPKDTFIDIFREGKEEREENIDVREKHQSVAMCPDKNQTCDLSVYGTMPLTTEPHWPEHMIL